MDTELVKCDCCGLKEECTEQYIAEVKSHFEGKWLCGLCSEAVRDEASRLGKKKKKSAMDEAVRAHMSFCSKYNSNPAIMVAEGMRQMLRRRSGDAAAPATPKKCSRAAGASQVGFDSSFGYY